MNDETKIICVKGFDANMQCRGYQFKIGESYTHDGPVEACSSGFHSVEYPLDVFNYYTPESSLYAEVEASGKIARHEGDSKVASARLHVKVALTIPDLVSRAIAWVTAAQCNPANASHTDADQSASSSTGDRSASLAVGSYSSSEIKPADDGSALNAIAIATGFQSKARAPAGSAIVLVERDDNGNILHIRASKVGENCVAPDCWYTLRGGNFVEVTEAS